MMNTMGTYEKAGREKYAAEGGSVNLVIDGSLIDELLAQEDAPLLANLRRAWWGRGPDPLLDADVQALVALVATSDTETVDVLRRVIGRIQTLANG